MAKYKITYLTDTFENTEDNPVMDLKYWTYMVPGYRSTPCVPCDEAEQEVRKQRPDLLETRVIEYKGEPLDDDWQEYQCEVLDIQGDIVNWEEA
jgi:hypothetical protein